MNKLSKKFIIAITIILTVASLCSILFNTSYLEKYYLFQKKTTINDICENFSKELESGISPDDAIKQIENSHKVIIAQIDNRGSISNDKINDEIRRAFLDKGIGFQKYWLWDKDFEDVVNGKNRIRLYSQDKLNYSLLVEYTYIDAKLFAITMIIPNISDAFAIINTFLVLVNIIAIIISIVFIIFLIRKITKPLHDFENFAFNMKNNKFVPLKIITGDELENVANSLNLMGSQIIDYQNSLEDKNKQMEQLIDDVAHDLKTPVSLIQLYANAIKDGLDDGTFLNTICEQNSQMEEMINRLLFLTRIDKEVIILEKCNISKSLKNLLDTYLILANERNLKFIQNISDDIIINANSKWIDSIFSNLITNSIKYSSSSNIFISLDQGLYDITFIISNESDNKSLNLSKIWNPYYVGEKSRNKHMSGTGLGLSIVKKMTDKLGYNISCDFKDQIITFTVEMPLS